MGNIRWNEKIENEIVNDMKACIDEIMSNKAPNDVNVYIPEGDKIYNIKGRLHVIYKDGTSDCYGPK